MHLSMSTRTVACTAVAALLLAGCSSAVSAPAVPSSGSTTARSAGGQVHLSADGWDASVPSAGSLTLTAHPGLPAASRGMQFGVTPAADPVGLTLSGAPFPAAGATLAHRLVAAVPAGQDSALAYWDDKLASWIPVPST